VKHFFETLYYHPKGYQYLIILILLPLSFIYGTLMLVRRFFTVKKEYDLPIVSVGNLIVGGSGKTPFVIALGQRYAEKKVTVISRGYGRQSRGLVEVSREGDLLVKVQESGDEAMLIARSLPKASVIVSENREEAIACARQQGAELIILDDGFNRVNIKKFEILLEPEKVANILPFPAGPYREFWFVRRCADLLMREKRDFKRVVEVSESCRRMLLATAIANPARLEEYLPQRSVVGRFCLEDHAYFDEAVLKQEMEKAGAECLLVTQKDAVKMEGFKLPVVEMRLKLEINEEKIAKIDNYIKKYKEPLNEE
jgi:tetraacyldisaccharide 4'-kinase